MELISPVVQRWVQDARENPEAFWGRAAEPPSMQPGRDITWQEFLAK